MNNQNKQSNQSFPWWIPVIFMGLAVSFLFNVWGSPKEIKQNLSVDSKFTSNDTVRDPLEIAKVSHAGFKYNCNSCHRTITSSKKGRSDVAAHENIKLEHGINKNCYNCHHAEKRESLVGINGEEIPFSKSELLCQKCHGPKYRDWLVGVHGRPNGYWDKSLGGETVKAKCAACHNPHSPKFQPMEPAPAPQH